MIIDRLARGGRGRQEDALDQIFTAIEATALSTWLREDVWAFPIVLIFHTVGLGLLAGPNIAIDARILGLARGVPLPTLERYFVVAWLGFWLNATSGILLLLAYPTKALTNPLFYGKLTLIAAAMTMMGSIRRSMSSRPFEVDAVADRPLRLLAIASLVCWGASITAGRLLAYTYSWLLVGEPR